MARIYSSTIFKRLSDDKVEILQPIRIMGITVQPTVLPSDTVIGGFQLKFLLDKTLNVKFDKITSKKDIWVILGITKEL